VFGIFMSILKFFPGILLVQVVTAAELLLALRSEQPEVWLMLALFAATTGFLAALWFASLLSHAIQDAVSKVSARFSEEREHVRTRAEQEKARVVVQSHQQIARERSRAQAKANVKVGAAVAALLGLSGFMLLAQFVTLGLLALASAGGAVGGYLFRLRQEQQRQREAPSQALDHTETGKLIESRVTQASRLLADKGANARP
jgi:hypothetical protein